MSLVSVAFVLITAQISLRASAAVVPGSQRPLDNETTNDEDSREVTNAFVEEIIDAFRSSIGDKLDPLKVSEQRLGFDRKLIGIRFHGDALIRDGKLHGLSGLRRTGNAFLGPNSGSNTADVHIGVDKLNFTAFAKVSFLGLSRSSDLLVTINHVDANIKAHLDRATGKPVIREVKVLELDGVQVKLPGLGGFLSSIVSLLSKAIVAAFKGTIKRQIEEGITRVSNYAIRRNGMRFS